MPQQWAQPGPPMFTPTGPKPRRWLRPVIALVAVVALGAGFWGLTAVSEDGKPHPKSASEAMVGECLENRGSQATPHLFTIGCNNTKADYKIVTHPGYGEKCRPEYDTYEERGGRLGEPDRVLCLGPLHH
ncbi:MULTISPECIES: hypothetical protein [unclassified Streptomyces]|uniref:LppU/SCO3897 family protein n=1 Tax=unclassified Streptomyces TaxID=2593676 RepID=UPI003801753C